MLCLAEKALFKKNACVYVTAPYALIVWLNDSIKLDNSYIDSKQITLQITCPQWTLHK